jgi:hypothetical protein
LDIDAMDSQESTPLHTACQGEASPTMIELLVHHGSHRDSVDGHGKTAISYTADMNAIKVLTPRSKVDQLKCLCARLTSKEDLDGSLLGLLPTKLKKFVRLHGVRRT